jgi:hypothetical protein
MMNDIYVKVFQHSFFHGSTCLLTSICMGNLAKWGEIMDWGFF